MARVSWTLTRQSLTRAKVTGVRRWLAECQLKVRAAKASVP